MDIKETFVNRKCDCCGQMLDEENWYPTEVLDDIARESGFRRLGGRDYCPDCWWIDDDDHIACKDGRIYDDDGNRVDGKIFIEDLGEKTQHQVKAIILADDMKKWFDSLPDEEKEEFAEKYPEFIIRTKQE